MSKPVVYTKPSCVQCNATARWLETRFVEYETRDLSHEDNLDKLVEFQDMGLLTAPIVEWDGETFAGFNPMKLQECLDAAEPENAS